LPVGFALLMWLLRPEYLRLLIEHPTGRALLLVAGCLEAAGFGLMWLLGRVRA